MSLSSLITVPHVLCVFCSASVSPLFTLRLLSRAVHERLLIPFMTVQNIYMSPALLCKSSIQSGNAEQCALAFIHLLSSSCTSYFYNISYMFVLFVNASVWQYCQQHRECILSDPGPIFIIIIIIFIVFVVQLFHCIL